MEMGRTGDVIDGFLAVPAILTSTHSARQPWSPFLQTRGEEILLQEVRIEPNGMTCVRSHSPTKAGLPIAHFHISMARPRNQVVSMVYRSLRHARAQWQREGKG